jgi:hypothetical protein
MTTRAAAPFARAAAPALGRILSTVPLKLASGRTAGDDQHGYERETTRRPDHHQFHDATFQD